MQRVQVRREHEDVRKRRLDEFMAGFNCISLRLKEMYQMITLGGDAELELVDSLDPFSEVPLLCWSTLCTQYHSFCMASMVRDVWSPICSLRSPLPS